jgi:hypothetical protein
MTNSQAIARIYETYTEDELRDAKDEPDYGIEIAYAAMADVVALFDDDKCIAHATRNRVRRAFQNTGHGVGPADAIANARRILKQDDAR